MVAHRFRTGLVAWTFLVVAIYSLSKASSDDGEGQAASYSAGVRETATRIWQQQSFWQSSSGRLDVKSVQWTQEHPGSVDNWEQQSLKRWQDSAELTYEHYDTEPNHRPHNGTYTGALLWLTRLGKMRETLASLESIARYMPMEQAYSIIFLHSGDLARVDVQEHVLERWEERADEVEQGGERELADKMRVMSAWIEYLEIDMNAPAEVQRRGMDQWEGVVFGGDLWPGYHSMCRFFATQIFWNHRIRQFDYYMRMDSDSYILSPMYQDPFRRIHTSGASYAWRHPGDELEYVVHGMPDYIERYMDEHEHDQGAEGMRARVDESRIIEAARNERKGGMSTFYNNWELVHVPSFRRPGVREWLVQLAQQDEGFYRYRWGDAPLRYATIKMFFPETQYERYCDFAYHHQFLIKEGIRSDENPPTWECINL